MENKIKERRKEMNLTQEELAREIGVTKQYISELENKGSYPSLERSIQIANVLNTCIYDLWNFETESCKQCIKC